MDLKQTKILENKLIEGYVSKAYLRKQTGQENGEYLLIVFNDGTVFEIGSNDMTGELWFEDYRGDSNELPSDS